MSDVNATSVPGQETFPATNHHQPRSHTGQPLGARLLDGRRCEFRVWAPQHDAVELHIVAPDERRIAMNRRDGGYHDVTVEECGEGTRYLYVLGSEERPDPASRLQPDGVHGPSEVVSSEFEWHDQQWQGIPLEDYVIYELHVGTFTEEGTFDSAIGKLDGLKELGITAVELLPVAQFPGSRNWGYDGVYAGAAQNSYGGPRALKRLVDACHQRGLAILLDVVYNHLGPEGNYLSQFAPYFTDRYKTPWGLALNFDGPHSDDVRWYFIHSALQWIDEFHFDGLRVDAVHAIVDHSAEPFLQDLNVAVHERAAALGRQVFSIAESDLNDPRVITPSDDLGLDFDSQWSDDWHHAIHTLLTGEQSGYYEAFGGTVSELARVLTTGYLYIGQHSPHRGRKYGVRPKTKDGRQFVISAQNHDQVGNRMMGERLSALVSPEELRVAAAALVLSPFIPMIFMGEEYGETAPFQYFTSHSDESLIEAVRKGRAEEFQSFAWQGEAPDPHDEETYRRSKLDWERASRAEHAELRRLFGELLALRRSHPALKRLDLGSVEVHADDAQKTLVMRRWSGDAQAIVAFNFSDANRTVALPEGSWKPLLETGPSLRTGSAELPAHSFAVWGG